MPPAINDRDARRAESVSSCSADDLQVPLVAFSSSSADSYKDEDAEQHDAFEPLLPTYRPVSPSAAFDEAGHLRRRRFTRLAILAAIFVSAALAGFLLFPSRSTAAAPLPLLPTPPNFNATLTPPLLSSTEAFLLDPSTPNEGVIPFLTDAFSPVYRPAPLQHPLSTLSWPSAACLEQFVSSGELCPAVRGHWAGEKAPRVDVIHTWVNGSSAEAMADWRKKVSDEVGRRRRLKKRAAGNSVLRHFREHDELRFSIRSVVRNIPSSSLSTLHLVVSDTPTYSPYSPPSPGELSDSNFDPLTARFAQVPHWVNLSKIEFAAPRDPHEADEPRLRVHSTTELFKLPIAGEGDQAERKAAEWQEKVLPTFNSLAVESQFANLEDVAPSALYLNDDFFVMQPLTTGDIESPFSGPVFRMQRDLLVTGASPDEWHGDPDGEWRGLGYTAWLLDERFGKRARPYLTHIAKALSLPILKEAQQVFVQELTATAAARFRGKAPSEVVTAFLLVHYTVEKHRESLLYSFLVARSDVDRSGTYSLSERRALLDDLGYAPPFGYSQQIPVRRLSRSTLSSLPAANAFAGLSNPDQTVLEFSSHDGYAYLALRDLPGIPSAGQFWPAFDQPSASAGPQEPAQQENDDEAPASAVCILDLVACFGEAFLAMDHAEELSVNEVFRRVAYEQPQCGDCLVALLVGKSGERGLEAFLPLPNEDEEEEAEETVDAEAIALEGTKWRDLDFAKGLEGSGSLRRRTAALIHRYSYTIGDSSASFQSIRFGGPPLSEKLRGLSTNPPAFLALNDDLITSLQRTLDDVNRRLKEWFESVWSEPSRWEKVAEGAVATDP
ncbi:hypothetical protein JCM10213_004346 [Rhodosporidiobolus nylandii]